MIRCLMLVLLVVGGCGSAPQDDAGESSLEEAPPESTSVPAAIVEVPPPIAAGIEPGDTVEMVLRRLQQQIAHLSNWRDSTVVALRQDSGTVRADSSLLQVRQAFNDRVTQVVRQFDGAEFQILIWPEGWTAERHRRAQGRPPLPDSQDIALASSVREFLADRGIWSRSGEGGTHFSARDAKLIEWFGKFATEPMKELLSLWKREQESPTAADGGLMIDLDELGARIAATERWLSKYPDAVAHESVEEKNRWYLTIFLGGLPSSRPFHWRSKVLEPKWRSAYERYASENGGERSGKVVKWYLDFLQDAEYRFGPEVEEFLRTLWRGGDPYAQIS